jgi:hypothetical protein
MKGRRHSPKQVVRKLREVERLLAEGAEIGMCVGIGGFCPAPS